MGAGVFDSWSVSLVGTEEKVDSELSGVLDCFAPHLGRSYEVLSCTMCAPTVSL